MIDLVLASHNPRKIAELDSLLSPLGLSLASAAALDLPEPEETEVSYLGNARLKAHAAARATCLPALADDSGFEVDALDGAPGVLTADWASTADGRDWDLCMDRVHAALLASGAPQPWRCRFVCTLVLAFPDGSDVAFTGAVEGHALFPRRGDDGVELERIFAPLALGGTRVFAEMSAHEKAAASYRAQAVDALARWLPANREMITRWRSVMFVSRRTSPAMLAPAAGSHA